MDINQLLSGIHCTCGKHHTCNIQYVYIENGAISRLEAICKEYRKLLIVADENTYQAAGERTEDALKGKMVDRVIFSGKEVLVPNEAAVKTVTDRLGEAEMIVAIGSGVIQDLCKYVSFYNRVPYLVVATAPSMDGYASNGAAMITDGMKVTYPAGLPLAILADTEVLAEAPMEMLRAGYGDIIGKFSALNDWKLSHLVNGEYFCQYIYDLTFEQISRTIKLADGILRREEESVKTLMEALVIIGIMMSFAGSSRPASGSEHHLSHFFEITGIVHGADYFPHGIDVAYSTVITAKLREKLLSVSFSKKIFRPKKSDYLQTMKRVYTTVADGCVELQEKVGNYKKDPSALYLEKEKEIKEILSQGPTAEEIEQMLELADLHMRDFYALYDGQKRRDAVLYAKDLKDRYTVLWLYYDLLGDRAEG